MSLRRFLEFIEGHDCDDSLEFAESLLREQERVVVEQSRTISCLAATVDRLTAHVGSGPAATGKLTIGGSTAVEFHVGDTGEFAVPSWTDDEGNPTTDVAAIATQVYESSDPNVVSVDPSSGALTFVGIGAAQVSLVATKGDGTVVPVTPVDVSVVAGAAAAGSLAIVNQTPQG